MTFVEMAVAIDQQHHGFKPFSRSQRCRLQSYSQLDYSILAQYSLNNANCFHKSFSTPCLSLTRSSCTSAFDGEDKDFDDDPATTNISPPRIEVVGGTRIPRVHALVVEVTMAMASGAHLLPVSSGLGGAYYLYITQNGGQCDHTIAVVKPIDEEPLAFNNPKGYGAGARMLGQPGLKRSVRIGESGVRELAAYLLDHRGFAGVPPTALVKISHGALHINNIINSANRGLPYKIASLQRFVDHEFDAGELGSSGFSVSSVHRIGILDVRLLNLDRHAGNMLVKKYDDDHEIEQQHSYANAVGVLELVPIDHGLCLPEWLDDPYFEWLHWPQASVPFSDSEIDYISHLDPYTDAQLLRTHIPCLQEAAIRVLVLCTIFLKQAAASGLCLADIGEMMTRQLCGGEERLSALENLCFQVEAAMRSSTTAHDDDEKLENRLGQVELLLQLENQSNKEAGNFSTEKFDLGAQLLESHPPAAGISKPPIIMSARFSSVESTTGMPDACLSPVFKENDDQDNDDFDRSTMMIGNYGSDDGSITGERPRKVGVSMKSVCLEVPTLISCEKAISFGDMSGDEWEFFLDSFKKLLPDLLHGIKCLSSKQRLGTCCKFGQMKSIIY